MLLAKSGFWNFESSSKIDVLQEGPHTHTILRALADIETLVMPEGDSFIVYGNSEALLVKPRSLPIFMSLFILSAFSTLRVS